MNPGTDHFDDGDPTCSPHARRLAIPRLAPGPHQQELRRALMREARVLSGRRQASAGAGRVPPLPLWLGRRPAFTVSAVVLLIAVLLWAAYLHQGRSGAPSGARRIATTTTNQSPGRGLGAALGLGSSIIDTRTAGAIRDAVEKSQLQLELVLPKTDGSRTYVYRTTTMTTTTTGGDSIVFASSRVLATKSLPTPVYEQEFEQAITRGKGRVVGESVGALGSRVWRYRVALSNGMGETYGAEREPDDVGLRERHKNALNAAMINGSGEVAQTLPGVDDDPVVLVKVTLDDGTIKTYAGPAKPGGM